jgi:hypothetical protein
MVLHGFIKQSSFEGFTQEPNYRNGDLSSPVGHRLVSRLAVSAAEKLAKTG